MSVNFPKWSGSQRKCDSGSLVCMFQKPCVPRRVREIRRQRAAHATGAAGREMSSPSCGSWSEGRWQSWGWPDQVLGVAGFPSWAWFFVIRTLPARVAGVAGGAAPGEDPPCCWDVRLGVSGLPLGIRGPPPTWSRKRVRRLRLFKGQTVHLSADGIMTTVQLWPWPHWPPASCCPASPLPTQELPARAHYSYPGIKGMKVWAGTQNNME